MKQKSYKLLRSAELSKVPSAEILEHGELALNYAKGSEGLYIKNNENEVVKLQTDVSNLITDEEFLPVSTAALNAIAKGTLGTINGESIEDGNIEIDLSLYRIVSSLPTTDILDNKIYLLTVQSGETNNMFDEYLYDSQNKKWEKIGSFRASVDLKDYIKTVDGDKRYVKTGSNASIMVDSKGAMANVSDNGQAFLAVRPQGAKFLINTPYAAAAFGVKDDSTAAFSHKTYTSYDSKTGTYTGAKNTAVLQFAGPVGLRYAKNTGSASDVTEAMYRYVGVIDSPDEFQRVYSAKQVDDLLKTYTDEINKLKQAIIDLGGTIPTT